VIAFTQEHYSLELGLELLPLVRRNWRESPSYEEGVDADPDFERYRRLDEAGACLFLSARDAGTLIGYVVFFVLQSPHHKSLLVAHGDAFYVLPEHRGHGLALYRKAEAMLRERGVKRVGFTVDIGSYLHQLLGSVGYRNDELVVEKIL
jgi:GNAT superfamily N-acetyltransferase